MIVPFRVGAVIDGTTHCMGGRWNEKEKRLHINHLELKEIYLGLKALCSTKANVHIKLLSDNQTAVSYIKNMGGTHSPSCNNIARETILWCKARNIWLSLSHIPGNLMLRLTKLAEYLMMTLSGHLTPAYLQTLWQSGVNQTSISLLPD